MTGPGSSTFVVVDFFDYESQTTSLVSGTYGFLNDGEHSSEFFLLIIFILILIPKDVK